VSLTYALLIYRTAPPSEPIPEIEERLALEAHRRLQAEASTLGDLRVVARLDDVRTAKTVRPRSGAHEVSDGPYVETKEWLVGFYLVDCESEEVALSRARVLCPDSSHVVEVRPVTWQRQP